MTVIMLFQIDPVIWPVSSVWALTVLATANTTIPGQIRDKCESAWLFPISFIIEFIRFLQ